MIHKAWWLSSGFQVTSNKKGSLVHDYPLYSKFTPNRNFINFSFSILWRYPHSKIMQTISLESFKSTLWGYIIHLPYDVVTLGRRGNERKAQVFSEKREDGMGKQGKWRGERERKECHEQGSKAWNWKIDRSKHFLIHISPLRTILGPFILD